MDEEIEVVVKVPETTQVPAEVPAVVEAVAVIAAAADVLDVKATEINIEHINARVTELNIRLDGVFDLLRNIAVQNEALLATQVASLQEEVKTKEKVEEVEELLEEVAIPETSAPKVETEAAEPEARKSRKRGFI